MRESFEAAMWSGIRHHDVIQFLVDTIFREGLCLFTMLCRIFPCRRCGVRPTTTEFPLLSTEAALPKNDDIFQYRHPAWIASNRGHLCLALGVEDGLIAVGGFRGSL
jgi:hypothetical protein